MPKKSKNYARCAAEISTFLTSDHVSFTLKGKKTKKVFILQSTAVFLQCLLDVTPNLQTHVAREACLTKSEYIILHSGMELLLNNQGWVNGYKKCVPFKGEATRLKQLSTFEIMRTIPKSESSCSF